MYARSFMNLLLFRRGKTHKRDVVQFAKHQASIAFNNENKSFEEREASYVFWQILAVMVQQNGVSHKGIFIFFGGGGGVGAFLLYKLNASALGYMRSSTIFLHT